MHETLINLLQENRVEKFRGERGRGKEVPSATVTNEEIPQEEEEQPSPLRQCNNLAKSSNDESSHKEEDDGTTCKICKIPWI